jgi:hypothetical protein
MVGGVPDFARSDERYEEAFREAGFDEVGSPPESLAAKIKASDIRNELLVAFDNWSFCARDPRRRRWASDLAQQAGGDTAGWRGRVRDPAIWKDEAILFKVIKTAPFPEGPDYLTIGASGGPGLLDHCQVGGPLGFAVGQHVTPPEPRRQAAGVASRIAGRGNPCGSTSRGHRGRDSGRRRQVAQPGGMTYTFSWKVQHNRKNWEFLGSPEEGPRAAVLFTILAGAKRHRLEPWAYVRDVLLRLSVSDADLEALLPDHWAASHPEHVLKHRLDESRRKAAKRKEKRQQRRASSSRRS